MLKTGKKAIKSIGWTNFAAFAVSFLFFTAIITEYYLARDYTSFYFFRTFFLSNICFLYKTGELFFGNIKTSLAFIILFVVFCIFVYNVKKKINMKMKDGKLPGLKNIILFAISFLYFIPFWMATLAGVTYKTVYDSIPDRNTIETYQKRTEELMPASIEFIPEIENILKKIRNNPKYAQEMPLEQHKAFNAKINALMRLQGGPLSKEQHYLRNFIDIAPPTLEDMLSGQNTGDMRWKILTPNTMAYHMFGDKGEYNIKFLSEDGFYEAIYNYNGSLLTAENDLVNMSTYNYADTGTENKAHNELDVIPYFLWGNTGEDKPFTPIDLVTNMQKFYQNKEARLRYDDAKKRMAVQR
jgi:hypothetical protein